MSAFWTVDDFTGAVVHTFTLDNITRLFTDPLFGDGRAPHHPGGCHRDGHRRGDRRADGALHEQSRLCAGSHRSSVVAVTTPLWASYLVKAYAWRIMLAPNGPLAAVTGGHTPGYGLTATVITLAYLWLPYMVIPVYAGFDRVPRFAGRGELRPRVRARGGRSVR